MANEITPPRIRAGRLCFRPMLKSAERRNAAPYTLRGAGALP